ncbi:unnamed protein product (macronuclear) [Paramecium tetraurelia]|uniref:Uncharacterized protein n=1 Tax=Paramecium tetraurelia TaxID=5888 RepID=A0CYM4_PARTE|nr:uncharacterized protein GSPATT00011492001 [Paramecium tetraurelia]CAK75891.1 unnamed protein product [Paramecium tetraurelia]|eukprot:XP_001443288.1 hypothetical protein (macronuclear) [Paramecium tetraurelia strain d4-2]
MQLALYQQYLTLSQDSTLLNIQGMNTMMFAFIQEGFHTIMEQYQFCQDSLFYWWYVPVDVILAQIKSILAICLGLLQVLNSHNKQYFQLL